jgi:hypothetical protein
MLAIISDYWLSSLPILLTGVVFLFKLGQIRYLAEKALIPAAIMPRTTSLNKQGK